MRRGDIVIEQDNATGGVSYWQKTDNQSVADSNGVSLAEYVHALYGLLVQAGSRKVALIGGAGGTLATMLARRGVAVTMVDIDARAFAIARAYFRLPASVACHLADGAAFLVARRECYDAVVLDAYADEEIPRHLRSTAFFRLARSRLRPGGLFLVNLIVEDDDDPMPDRFVQRLGLVWRKVRLLDADGFDNRNAIAVAGRVAGLTPPRLLRKPARGARALAAGLKALAFRGPRD